MSMQSYAIAFAAKQIEGSMQQSNATQTAAEKADLQNRLLAEQAIVENEQTRLNLMGHHNRLNCVWPMSSANVNTRIFLLGVQMISEPLLGVIIVLLITIAGYLSIWLGIVISTIWPSRATKQKALAFDAALSARPRENSLPNAREKQARRSKQAAASRSNEVEA